MIEQQLDNLIQSYDFDSTFAKAARNFANEIMQKQTPDEIYIGTNEAKSKLDERLEQARIFEQALIAKISSD